jgi:hypothetical protein
MPKATPWSTWLRVACMLGVSPVQFWALALLEWRALAVSAAGPSLSRAELQTLSQRFPDLKT